MAPRAINGARVVTPDGVVEGASVIFEGGRIAGISARPGRSEGAVDAADRYVLPGIVDLHSDVIEQHLSPRAGVRFDDALAFVELDRMFAGTGTTTALHRISFMETKTRSVALARELLDAIVGLRAGGLVRHEVHLRCEYLQDGTVEAVEELLPTSSAKMASLTDHTPGQGQFRDLEAYRMSMRENAGEDEETVEAAIELASRRDPRLILARAERVARAAAKSGVRLASHDDDSPEKARLLAERGVTVCEFPTNVETAREAKQLGLSVAMGAPNVVLGRSSAGNLSAAEAVRLGLVDALVSDYHPPSMLQAAFKLAEDRTLPLHEAVGLVSSGPARAVGLSDRGEIREGALADLIVVGERFGLPVVTHAIVGGEVVLASGRPDHPSKKTVAVDGSS